MTAISTSPDPLLAEQGARWRFTVHRRDYTGTVAPAATGVAELGARSRRIETGLNVPARMTFTVDGRSAGAAEVQELTTEIIGWRTDPVDGTEAMRFRGVVSASEDTISEQSHVVNFTAFSYDAMLARRYLTAPAPVVYAQADQDAIVADLLHRATDGMRSGKTAASFAPGSKLPLALARVHSDGTPGRANSGQLRDRTYPGGSAIGQLITDLGAVIGGYDYDVAAVNGPLDTLRVFYPSQGVGRSDVALVYGVTVAALTRTVSTSDGGYGNYVRVVGDNGGGAEDAPQLISEAWNQDANNVGVTPVGLWQATDNASDVNQQATLDQKAQGDLATSGVLVPSYTLTLRPGWYRPGRPALGDTVPLVVDSGRLHVSATVRVVGLNYLVGDDGQEDVELVVGRPALTLSGLFKKTRQDVDALARR